MEPTWISQFNLPTLDIGERCGWTDYIGFIDLDEMKEPAYKGVDLWQRDFVCIKFKLELFDDSPGSTFGLYNYLFGSSILVEKRFQTFFRRYSDNTRLYMGCGHGKENLIATDGGMTKEQIKFICDILEKGSITLTPEEATEQRVMNVYKYKYTRCVVSIDK